MAVVPLIYRQDNINSQDKSQTEPANPFKIFWIIERLN